MALRQIIGPRPATSIRFAGPTALGRASALLRRPERQVAPGYAIVLQGREREHAGVVAVVHEVLDGVGAGEAGAAVAALGAAGGGAALAGGVGDAVASSAASALKGVEEAEPVADL